MEKIGALLGKVLRLDYSTKAACKGQYSRACVELDLTKPLTWIIYVEGHEHKVEYEGLDLIWFKCGRYGHKQDTCNPTDPETILAVAITESPVIPTVKDIAELIVQLPVTRAAQPPPAAEKSQEFGSWMVVNDQRKPQPNKGIRNQGET